MTDKRKLAKDFVKNKKLFTDDFPYLNDVEFLTYLREEYEKVGNNDISVVIDARIKIFEAKYVTDDMINELKRKIEIYKASRGNVN